MVCIVVIYIIPPLTNILSMADMVFVTYFSLLLPVGYIDKNVILPRSG